jgi:hypothetical protein
VQRQELVKDFVVELLLLRVREFLNGGGGGLCEQRATSDEQRSV